MPLSEARKRANKKWNDANMTVKYDHAHLVIPKGDKDVIKAAAEEAGQSVNAYILQAIEERIQREQANK